MRLRDEHPNFGRGVSHKSGEGAVDPSGRSYGANLERLEGTKVRSMRKKGGLAPALCSAGAKRTLSYFFFAAGFATFFVAFFAGAFVAFASTFFAMGPLLQWICI